jgi:hypothetical protein
VAWGTVFPGVTLLVVIGAPLPFNPAFTKGVDVLTSPGILDHFAHHQWSGVCDVLWVLSDVQVFVPLAV